jgi:curli production assembly/transport component CsgG
MRLSTSLKAASLMMAVLMLAAGCASTQLPAEAESNAVKTPSTKVTRDLLDLPRPKGKVAVAVYAFRDQTGQYKPAPDSSFSTSVTQGAASLLVKALKDSGWFAPVEREGLQNLLTERKIVRALEVPPEKNSTPIQIPQIVPASIIIEGGVIAYESNVRTGGVGVNVLGIGLSTQYRVDQVTINLRSVDIRTGNVLSSVLTSKTIYSYEVRPSVYKFVNFKDLVQFEAGMTRNEPGQLCVREAIESAVVHLIVQGLQDHMWELSDKNDWYNKVIQEYARDPV